MNIDSPHFPDKPPFPQDNDPRLSRSMANDSSVREFEQSADMAALRPLLSQALCLLDDSGDNTAMPPEALPGYRIILSVSESVGRLQDAFLEALAALLAKSGCDSLLKLTLRLDEQASIRVNDDHPEAARLQAEFDQNPELARSFAEIAVQSALLRDLRNLQNAAVYATSNDSYMALALAAPKSAYQISLKGDMSHFYFSR